MLFAQFMTVVIVHLLAVMSPGPDFAMVTRNSLIYSRKIGIYTSLGIALALIIHVAYSLLGIGFLIAQSIVLFSIIKFVGAGYLIYIGYKSLRAKAPAQISASAPVAGALNKTSVAEKIDQKLITTWQAFKTGFITNALNPKATLFFLALFTQVIDPNTSKIVQLTYGLEMVVMTFIWFSIVSMLFSNPLIKGRVAKFQHYIERVTGAVLIALGIKVAMASHK